MSEFAPSVNRNHIDESERVHDVRLAHLAALVVEASMRSDLAEVAKAHVASTGVENPNTYAPNRFRIGEQVVPENSDSVYRQIQEPGIDDLAESGVVRGAKTAGKPAKTEGHTVYWNNGETGKGSTLGQGFVIEAPLKAAERGWVRADEVTGIYTRDSDGRVKNILPTK